MIYGNASWGFRETPLERQLEITRGMGLEVLELGIAGHPSDFLNLDSGAKDIAAVKGMFGRHGVRLECASTGNDFTLPDPAACRAELERVGKALGMASALGVGRLRVFAGFSPVGEVVGERWGQMVDCLAEAAGLAASLGVELAVETHGGVEAVPGGVRHFHSAASHPGTLRRLLDELGPDVKLVFDPANLGAVGLDTAAIVELYRSLKDRIAYMHLKDFRSVGRGALLPCACGEGGLDWRVLAQEFRGFPGPGLLEYENPEDVEAGLRRSLAELGRRPLTPPGATAAS